MLRAVSIDFPIVWGSLKDIVYKLIRCETVDRNQWNSSFSDVYSLCISSPVSHASTLYKSTTTLISDRVVEILLELQTTTNESDLLSSYVRHWEIYHKGLTYIDNLYRYMNIQHSKNLRPTEADMCYGAVFPMADQHTMEILEAGLAFWKFYLIDPIKPSLTLCLMHEVHKIGVDGQQKYINHCLASFMRVGELHEFERDGMQIYNEIFQNPLIDATKSYYLQWAYQRESECGCAQYVTEALVLRMDEQARALQYFKCSLEPIQTLFQKIIVEERLHFLNMNVRQFIEDEDKTNLKNLFRLLAPNNLCSELLHWFGEHVKTSIMETITNLPKDSSIHFIESLLDLRSRFLTYINDVFDGMNSFRNQMDKAFNLVINGRVQSSSSKSPTAHPRSLELLCKYMDSLLRRSSNTLSSSDIEAKLMASITTFKYIDDKDIFQKYYQRMLCKRLIFNPSSTLELEEFVINQLKVVCGYEFTSKFQRMFNDVQLAPEINQNFLKYLENNNISFQFGHHFHVLTQCSWPIVLTGVADFKLPDEVQSCTTHFASFYSSAHQGRKMRWAHNYSTAEVHLLFADKAYQIQLPSIQAAILLLFDLLDTDCMKVKDVHSRLQLTVTDPRANSSSTSSNLTNPTDEFANASFGNYEVELIHKFVVPLVEINLLHIESDVGERCTVDNPVAMEHTIVLNRQFTNKRLKIKINNGPQNKESSQTEADQVDRQVNGDRKYFIQAAVVRILKSRKQIRHSALIEAVLQQATNRFQPPIPLIKRCIEGLIDTGYLERNPDDPDQYSYLA